MLRLALAVSAVATALAQQDPGITASLSAAGMQYLGSAMIPVIEAKVASIAIPDISGKQSGFDYSLTGLTCSGFNIGGISVTTDPINGLVASLSNIGISCNGRWSFRLSVWPRIPYGSGSVSATVGSTSASVGLLLQASSGHLQAQPNTVVLNVGSLNFHFSGSLWSWLLNLFDGLIEKSVKSAASSVFTSAIGTIITSEVDPFLLLIPMAVPLPAFGGIAEVRYGLTAQPTYNGGADSYLGIALQGDVVSVANPISPPVMPPSLPAFSAANAANYLQLFLSSYTFDSAFYTFNAAGMLTWTIPSSKLPSGLNNTATYGIIAPGFPLQYPNAPVSLGVDFLSQPTIDMDPAAGINATAPVRLRFFVNDVTEAFVVEANTAVAIQLSVGFNANGSQALLAGITFLNTQLSVLSSNIGTVEVTMLETLANFVFTSVIIPIFNGMGAQGLPFPTVNGLALVNTQVATGNGFVVLATDFTFNPPFAVQQLHYTVAKDGSLMTSPVTAVVSKAKAAKRAASGFRQKRTQPARQQKA